MHVCGIRISNRICARLRSSIGSAWRVVVDASSRYPGIALVRPSADDRVCMALRRQNGAHRGGLEESGSHREKSFRNVNRASQKASIAPRCGRSPRLPQRSRRSPRVVNRQPMQQTRDVTRRPPSRLHAYDGVRAGRSTASSSSTSPAAMARAIRIVCTELAAPVREDSDSCS